MRSFVEKLAADAVFLEAASLQAGLAAIEDNLDVDLVLLDLSLPDADGVAGLKRLREAFPDVPVAVITGTLDSALMLQTLRMGAVGFVPKSALAQRLVAALRLMMSGGRYIPEELLGGYLGAPLIEECVTAAVLPAVDEEPRADADVLPSAVYLSPRQQEIASLLVAGLSNKEICRKLDISLGTVKHHLAGIFRAVGAATRAKAVHALARLIKD